MLEQINFDLMGQRRLIFDDQSVTYFTDEMYFIVPILVVGVSYSVVTNRPIPYAEIQSIGVVHKKQWWTLVMGLIFTPMGLWCMGVGAFASDPNNQFSWGMMAFFAIWLILMGLFPLWLFYRGRRFLAIASEKEVICFPMDRKKKQVRRAIAILKEKVTSTNVRWEIDRV